MCRWRESNLERCGAVGRIMLLSENCDFFPLFLSPKCSRLHPYNLPSVTKENNSTGSILPVSFGIVKAPPVLLGGGG